MYKIFFENVTFVISFVYIAMKLRDYAFKEKEIDLKLIKRLAPAVGGFLSFLLMLHPMEYSNLFFDLRAAPIYITSYIWGWKWGIISTILPTIYRIYLGKDSVVLGILLSVILPYIIGALFNRRKKFKLAFELISLKGQIKGFILFSVIRTVIGMFVFDLLPTFWLKYSVASAIFSIIILLIITLMINDFNQKNILEIELEHLSRHDPMTSLPNRRHCRYRALQSINKGIPVGLCLIDVDYFKRFNDTMGHQNGDTLLKELSEIFLKQVRSQSDFVSRYGGEEFILFCEGITKEEILTIAERVRKIVEQHKFVHEGVNPSVQRITISIGVSHSLGDKELDQLIEEADIALYKSKSNGRNKVTLFNTNLNF